MKRLGRLLQQRFGRAGLALAGLLLLIAAAVFAVASSRGDAALELRYAQTLDLGARALEVQRAAIHVYREHARMAARVGATEDLLAELRSLGAGLGELGRQLEGLRKLDAGDRHANEIGSAAAAVTRLQQQVEASASRDGGALRERLGAAAEREFESINVALASVLAAERARIDEAALQSRRLERFGRMAVLVAGALALSLGLLLTMIAWRSVGANARLLDQLQQQAREDGLTGIPNRRTLDEHLPKELARAQRRKDPLTVVMIDLDHFKRFNDRRGHAAGDTLLRDCAQAWQQEMRPSDLLARYGGEEFTLVLPGCDADQAAHLVDRLREKVPERQTFSAGIAQWDGIDSPQALLHLADHALLAAKRGGRNRSVIAGREPQMTLPLRVA